MKIYKETDMIRGWIVGNFHPTALKTKDCEVALKRYKKGDEEDGHHHKIATELTMIVTGKVMINGVEYGEGSIVVMEPGEYADFMAQEDSVNLVVKLPSVKEDKYPGKPE
ncbi:hypothetical protein EBZ39_03915 [bacterium]|nr:hypothetical protein [bacterium]